MSKVFCILVLTVAAMLRVSAATYYVDASRANDAGAGTSWGTAKKTIQAAVGLTRAGDTVLVTNGIYNTGATVTPGYALNNRVVITNAVTVRSINGPSVTTIEGSGTNWFNTSSAVRCVYMKSGVLAGFTLAKGTTFGSGLGSYDDGLGGGVSMTYAVVGTLVTNCTISGCTAYYGGGSYGGTLYNCTLAGNSAFSYAGGSYNGTLNNCVLTGNSSGYAAGGSYNSTLNNCALKGNSSRYGGGSCDGTLNNCVLSGNSSVYGGGADDGTLSNCVIIGNSSSLIGGGSFNGTLKNCTLSNNTASSGGGSYDGTLYNCALSGNTASSGGGSYNGTLKNCTLSGNTASSGGGSYGGTLYNCIVWGNKKSDGTTTNYQGTVFYYSCTTPLSAGGGNIDADPQLVDNQNLRLRLGSPCIDSGDNGYVSLTTDLLGNPRIQNGTVDMGAYEEGVLAVALPLFNPPSDMRLTNSVAVTITCATTGAVIRYTLDGSEPTATNAEYIGTFILTGTGTVKAKAFKEGLVAAQATATYTVCAADPVFDPPTGTTVTNSLTFSLSSSTEDSIIRYTINGTDPTASSILYTNSVSLFQTTTVKARTFKSSMTNSATAAATYTVMQTVAAPVFTPISGTVQTNSLSVTLSCATAGATIRYTLDGSEPTTSSSVYDEAIVLAQSASVKAKASKSGMADSSTATATYTVIQAVANPVFSPVTGTTFTNSLVITLTCATADAEIHYTTNGALPTASSTLFSKPLKVSKNTYLRARAIKEGMLESEILEASYFKVIPLPEAVDVANLLFTTGGDALWDGRILTSAHDGIDAARSGAIADSQSTWMETALNGPGILSFWWKTSCEDDPDADNWDFVSVSVDGAEWSRMDGDSDWQQVVLTLGPGAHVVRWVYCKDESVSEGADCAWVDQFVFGTLQETVNTPIHVPYAWLDQHPILLQMAGGNYEVAALIDADLDGYPAWEEYLLGTVPTDKDSLFRSLIQIVEDGVKISWTPDLGATRVYTVAGKTNLTDVAWGPTNAASRFFRVSVGMP